MASNIDKILSELYRMQGGIRVNTYSPLCLFLVTLSYLVVMLSVPAERLSMLLWYALWPIIGSPLLGVDFSKVFRRSLVILPFAVVIGIFNPIIDKQAAMIIGGTVISRGWITFASIVLRGMFSVQALLLLAGASGFISICRGLRKIGIPGFLTMQLQMVFRYLVVLMEEGSNMALARKARGYSGRMTLRMWGAFTGQLFLRSVDRAERIHRAMLARGFRGDIPEFKTEDTSWRTRDTLLLAISACCFVAMRVINISVLLENIGI